MAPDAAVRGLNVKLRFTRRSTGFHEFIREISKPEGQTVLVIWGQTSPANLHFITELGHRAYNEDLLLAASNPGVADSHRRRGQAKRIDVNSVKFLPENLDYHPESFDAVLLWDLADYLPEALVKPVIDRIYSVMKPKGLLLGFFPYQGCRPGSGLLPLQHRGA